MKNTRLIWIAALGLFLAACGNSNEQGKISTDVVTNSESAEGKQNTNLPELNFPENMHDFGKIKAGEVVTYSFKFTNTGKSDLIISNASASCGCTVPDYPRHPIKPGEEGKIDVKFDSNGKSGMQEKIITLATNCEPPLKELRIKCEVAPAQ